MKLNLLILLAVPTLVFADIKIIDNARYTKDVIFSTEPTEQEDAKVTLVRCLSTTKESELNRACKGRKNPYEKPLTMTMDKYVKALQNALRDEKDLIKVDALIDAILVKSLAGNTEAPLRRSDSLVTLALKPFEDLEMKHKADKLLADYMREEQEKIQKAEDQKKFEATRPYRCTAEGSYRMQFKRPQERGYGSSPFSRRYKAVSDTGLTKAACSEAAVAACVKQMQTSYEILIRDYTMDVELACRVTSAVPK